MLSKIQKLVAEAVGREISPVIQVSAEEKFGDYTTPVALSLAKTIKRPPLEIAEEIAAKLRAAPGSNQFKKIEVTAPGFINFHLSDQALESALAEITKSGAKWGRPETKTRATVIIDYSSPNIAKPMSVGHLRSTIIGAALYNIFKFSGWKTIGDNHLGDWGRQFGILIAAWKDWQKINGEKREVVINDLMRLYVDYNALMKEDAKLEERARLETKKLQDGDLENTKLWKRFYKISLAEFQKIYALLGIKFDHSYGESHYQKMLGTIVSDAVQKGVAVRSEGAVIIPVPGKAPLVIQKSDEAFLYGTTDIATVKQRVTRWKPSLILYVIGNEQALHLEQLFYAVKQLGLISKQKLAHVKFGLILGEDLKKLSTRAGKHIALDEVIYEAIERAKKVTSGKRPDLSPGEHDKIAKVVGIAALKYNDLSQNRQSDIAFHWDKMLNLEGNSAPYIMYTYARLKSVLRKAGFPRKANFSLLNQDSERALIKKLIQFPDVITGVLQTYFPHQLADYLYELTKLANYFYQTEPILQAEPAVMNARLKLISAAAQTIKTSLALLGISALEKM